MPALLDSGANSILMGSKGWKRLQAINIKLQGATINHCTLADGKKLACIGIVTLPIQLKDCIKVFDMYIVPKLRHTFVVNVSFWVKMEIIPDLRKGEWHFSDNTTVNSITMNNLQSANDLTFRQNKRLSQVVNEYFDKIKDIKLGCTKLIKHRIESQSPPIKSRYYPVSPYVQN